MTDVTLPAPSSRVFTVSLAPTSPAIITGEDNDWYGSDTWVRYMPYFPQDWDQSLQDRWRFKDDTIVNLPAIDVGTYNVQITLWGYRVGDSEIPVNQNVGSSLDRLTAKDSTTVNGNGAVEGGIFMTAGSYARLTVACYNASAHEGLQIDVGPIVDYLDAVCSGQGFANVQAAPGGQFTYGPARMEKADSLNYRLQTAGTALQVRMVDQNNPDPPRPEVPYGYPVMWVGGTTRPTAMQDGDFWVKSSG